MREILVLGNRIYHHRDHTDFNIQRLIVFWLRGLRHQQDILALSHFFQAYSELRKIESGNAIFYEEATRQVFLLSVHTTRTSLAHSFSFRLLPPVLLGRQSSGHLLRRTSATLGRRQCPRPSLAGAGLPLRRPQRGTHVHRSPAQ